MNEPTPLAQLEILTEPEAARYLAVQPRTLRLWRRKLGLPFMQLTGKSVRLRRSDIDAWLDARRVSVTA